MGHPDSEAEQPVAERVWQVQQQLVDVASRAAPGDVPIVCSLEPGQLGPRLDGWASLLEGVVSRTAIDGGVSLGFSPDPQLAAELAATAVAEQQCCSFYRFDLRITTEAVLLDVRAPAEAQALLASLFGQADG